MFMYNFVLKYSATIQLVLFAPFFFFFEDGQFSLIETIVTFINFNMSNHISMRNKHLVCKHICKCIQFSVTILQDDIRDMNMNMILHWLIVVVHLIKATSVTSTNCSPSNGNAWIQASLVTRECD